MLFLPGLAQEGCKLLASAVVYTSVRAARASVAMLHQKEIKGGKIWARQLGGEVRTIKKSSLQLESCFHFLGDTNIV